LTFNTDLLGAFREYFEIIPADTPTLLKESFRLRYQVYCEECRFPGFDAANYADELESDGYDERSVHSLLRHYGTGVWAGTVRLILAHPSDPEAPFPIEVSTWKQFGGHPWEVRWAERRALAEVSRLILSQRFRACRGERQWPDGVSRASRRVRPHAAILGLIKACVLMCWERQTRYCYCAMEPRLAERLKRFGLTFQPISPVLNHHGLVRAYLGHLPELLEGVYERFPEVWALLTDNGRTWPR